MRGSRVLSIARFEFLSVVKRWSYLIATFGLPLFLLLLSITIFGFQTYFLAQRGAESSIFGLVDRASIVDGSRFEAADGGWPRWDVSSIQVALYPTYAEAKRDLESGKLRGLYIVEEDYLQNGSVRALRSQKTPLLSLEGTAIEPALRSLLRHSLIENRLDDAVKERVLNPANFVRGRLNSKGELVSSVDRTIELLVQTSIPLFLGVLLLTALLSASGYLVQTIATDKESKVVEVLLSSASADEIVAGKLFGLGAAGFIQFGVWSSMLVAVAVSASTLLSAVAPIPWLAVGVAPIFFVLGYFFTGSLMLATAALGANAAESQKLTMIWAALTILPLMVLIVLLDEPHGPLGEALTWIPFTAPLTVIIRLAVDPGGIAPWEIVGSIIALALCTWIAIRIGARLFRVGFVLTGSRPSLAELWRQA